MPYAGGDSVEIGYSGLGATLGLDVLLRAVKSEYFVSSIELKCVRANDAMTRRFSWVASRPPALFFASQHSGQVEVPAGFLLEPRAPRHFYAIFSEPDSRNEVEAEVAIVRPLWRKKLGENAEALAQLRRTGAPGVNAAIEEGYREFSAGQEWLKAWEGIQRAFFWKEGKYEAELVVRTDGPKREFTKALRFSIARSESDLLYSNAVVIMRQGVGFSDWALSFVRSKYS